MTIRIVTFHTDDDRWERTPHPLGGRKSPRSDLVPLFVASVRISNPRASLELITDESTRALPGFDRVHRLSLDNEFIMLERLRGQCDLIAKAAPDDQIAFLDTDTIVLRPLADVFDSTFDVGVTIRDRPKFSFERAMPYNNGVIFVSLNIHGAALTYFLRKLAALEASGRETWAWSGNQLVVLDILGRRPAHSIVRVGGARIKIFSCSTHNYAPEGRGEDIRDKIILHFRGDAKSLMLDYFTESASQSETESLLDPPDVAM